MRVVLTKRTTLVIILKRFGDAGLFRTIHQYRGDATMPCGRKRKRKKIATHKRKKKLRKNRHKNK